MQRVRRVIPRACSLLAGQSAAWTTGLVLAGITLTPSLVSAQWTGGPTGPVYYNGGNVGIGTANPRSRLDVNGGLSIHALSFTDGSGTPYPDNWIGMVNWIDGTNKWLHIGGITDAGARRIALFADKTFVSGNVGVGTMNPQYKLAVEGAIGARDIIVTNAPWSDYVFRPGYRLRPPSEVNAYIEQHRHLPDIPSEAEVKAKGISVGEMQAKLLAKIEELTLHMIRLEEKNNRMEAELRSLQSENRNLQERMAAVR